MRTFVIALVIGLAAFAGAFVLENNGIHVPRISQLFNFGRPDPSVLNSAIYDQTGLGPYGYTPRQMADLFVERGHSVNWQQDRTSWILRVSGRGIMDGQPIAMSFRFVVPVDAASLPGPTRIIGQITLNGQPMSPYEAQNFLAQIYPAFSIR